jgi:hypothetical protein
MKKHLRHWAIAAAGAAAALAFTSCAYDPSYTSVGASYSSGYGAGYGYGDGYGYGNSNFSTSLFVSTGNPQWGYDPYCYSYYDYRRRCYYDPYLYGYYPVGYRPPVIIGCPHPYGWRPGRGYCPPPHHVRNVTVVNYRNRESSYRNSNYGWAKQIRQQPLSHGRIQGQHRDLNTHNRANSGPLPPMNGSNAGKRPPDGNYKLPNQGAKPYSQTINPPGVKPRSNGLPPAYNKPVADSSPRPFNSRQRQAQFQQPPRQTPPPNIQGGNRGGKHLEQPANSRGNNPNNPKASKEEKNHGLRSLGQG